MPQFTSSKPTSLREDQNIWTPVVSPETWSNIFLSFQESAFRLETLQKYTVPNESPAFEDYVKHKVQPDNDWMKDWCDTVNRQTSKGAAMQRVHIVDYPLSDYVDFEITCAYSLSTKAGEQVRLLDRKEIPASLFGEVNQDFWLFDRSTIMILNYDHEGKFLDAQMTENPSLADQYSKRAKQLWDLALPLENYADK